MVGTAVSIIKVVISSAIIFLLIMHLLLSIHLTGHINLNFMSKYKYIIYALTFLSQAF